MNKIKRDKIRNENMRDTKIEKQRIKFVRIQPNQAAARAYNTATRGYRASGGHKKQWIDSIIEKLTNINTICCPVGQAKSCRMTKRNQIMGASPRATCLVDTASTTC